MKRDDKMESRKNSKQGSKKVRKTKNAKENREIKKHS
jgi:hypothetical protein